MKILCTIAHNTYFEEKLQLFLILTTFWPQTPGAVLVEESAQQHLDPPVQPGGEPDCQPGREKVGNRVDLGLGRDVGGSALDHGDVAG